MTKLIQFNKLITIDQMLPNLDLIRKLTPTLTQEQYENYLRSMVPHNYYQVIAVKENEVIGLSGYWVSTKLYSGPYLEIDNFIVSEKHRNSGVGKALVQWMENEARENNCHMMMLDAYVENFKAHAFYYRQGFIARGFHYLKSID